MSKRQNRLAYLRLVFNFLGPIIREVVQAWIRGNGRIL